MVPANLAKGEVLASFLRVLRTYGSVGLDLVGLVTNFGVALKIAVSCAPDMVWWSEYLSHIAG